MSRCGGAPKSFLDSRHPLDQFLSVALYPLRLALRYSMVHKFILASSFPISTPHAEFLQDRTIIREYRLTALYSGAFRITLKQLDTKNGY